MDYATKELYTELVVLSSIYEKPWGQKNTPNFFRGILETKSRFWFQSLHINLRQGTRLSLTTSL